jgi:hypothetical protein
MSATQLGLSRLNAIVEFVELRKRPRWKRVLFAPSFYRSHRKLGLNRVTAFRCVMLMVTA